MDGRARGIDVSHWDGLLDWASIATNGIDFAIAKATDGTANQAAGGAVDAQFANNWAGIAGAGLIRGAYHFIGPPQQTTPQAQWNDDIHRQVDLFLATIGAPQPGDLPPTLDIEASTGSTLAYWQNLILTDRGSVLAIVREFIDYTAAQLGGIQPILYAGDLWRNYLGDPDPAADNLPYAGYPLWQPMYRTGISPPAGNNTAGQATSFNDYSAHLDGANPAHVPKVWGGPGSASWTIWQFSEFGAFPGQTATFDLNVFNGTPAALKAACIPAPADN